MKSAIWLLIIVIIFCCTDLTAERADTVNLNFQGTWIVFDGYNLSGNYTEENFTEVGILSIKDNQYCYEQYPETTPSTQIRNRFPFFESTTGDVEIEYWDNILSQNNQNEIVGSIRFNNQEENFLIRFDGANNRFYLHSRVSEIQLYLIVLYLTD